MPTLARVSDTSAGAGKLQDRTRAVLGPVSRKLWHFRLEGYERLPTDGPAILCPNHVSFLDSAFLMLTLPRRISFVGKSEYMDDWKTKFLFPAMGMIPIDRTGGKASMAALDTAERAAFLAMMEKVRTWVQTGYAAEVDRRNPRAKSRRSVSNAEE